jgi:hypothetical protein
VIRRAMKAVKVPAENFIFSNDSQILSSPGIKPLKTSARFSLILFSCKNGILVISEIIVISGMKDINK